MEADRSGPSERGAHLPDDEEKLSTEALDPERYREQIGRDRVKAGALSKRFEAQHLRYLMASIVLSATSSIFGAVAAVWGMPLLAVVPGVSGAAVVAINTWSATRKFGLKATAYSAAERALQRELVSYDGRADPYGTDLTEDVERAEQVRFETFVLRTQEIFDTLHASITKR